MRTLLLAAILGLAGCVAPLAAQALDAPVVPTVGSWFRIEQDRHGTPLEWTLVIHEVTPTHIRTAADDRDVAALDAAIDWVLIGDLSRDHLTLAGARSTFAPFRFPLEDGAVWNATWTLGGGEVPMRLDARYRTDLPMGEGLAGLWVVHAGSGEGQPAFRVTYSPEVGFITSFAQPDVDDTRPDASVLWQMRVVEWGRAYDGTVYVSEATPFGEATPGAPLTATVTGADRVLAFVSLSAPAGSIATAAVVMPDRSVQEWDTRDGPVQAEVFFDATEGAWQAAAETVGAGASASVELVAIREGATAVS